MTFDNITTPKNIYEVLDPYFVRTVSTTFEGIVNYNVDVGTTGYQGGDSGHGGRTYVKITQWGGCMAINKIETKNDEVGFEIALAGDDELCGMIKSLQFVLNVLKAKVEKTKDCNHEEASNFEYI